MQNFNLSIPKKTKRVIYFDIAIALLLCFFTFATTFGFLTDYTSKNNVLTVGNNYAEIVEEYDPPEAFEAGGKYTKKVSVINKDKSGNKTVPCYIRIFAEVEEPDTADKLYIDFNNTDWTEKQADGYYYYKKVLDSGETTTPLFTMISAKETVDSNFRLICYSESVQAEGFNDALEAFSNM